MSFFYDKHQQLRAFFTCVKLGGHYFLANRCTRCGAEKGGKSLLDLIAEKNAKQPEEKK